MTILSWQDNLPSKEMPPRWMWHLDAELVDHFEWVQDNRDSGPSGDDDDDDDDRPSRRRHGAQMQENVHSQGRGRNS